MNKEKFMQVLLNKAKESNFKDSEVYLNQSENFEIRLYKGKVDYYEENEEYGIAFRGKDKKMGYSYTEKLDEDIIDVLLNNAKNNAQIMEEDEEEIVGQNDNYEKLKKLTGIYDYNREEKIELLKEIEKNIYKLDEKIKNINYCIYADEKTGERIINSKGLQLNYENDIGYIYISVVAEDKGEVHTAAHYQLFRELNEVNAVDFAKKVVNDAVKKFNSEPVKSGSYKILLKNEVVIDLLSTFSSTFSAENVQKGLSLFKDKLNQNVANSIVNIIDDPFYEKGYRRTPFDSEGAASKYKEVIKDGKLMTYLHNYKTAKKSDVETTGNAYRGSHKSRISISPTNMYIKRGNLSFKELVEKVENGLIIDEVQGLHSGANPVSGDFSLSARGFLIEDKEIKKSVEQITISGNFLQLLKDIMLIGNDFKMGLPGSGHFGSASVVVESLDVSGL
jgi:PmbA protein